MPCYHPIPASHDPALVGVRLHPPIAETNLQLGCGTCLGCRTSHALAWAKRAEHEAKMWEHNCFITLTYDPEHLPDDGRLVPEHLQGFIKRLRAHHSRVYSTSKRRRKKYRASAGVILRSPRAGLRYLGSGEYGETYGRPHYHVLFFNLGFTDLYEVGKDLYQSKWLESIWTFGSHKIGSVTGASANYVAQYTLKNVGKVLHTPDGEILQGPFFRMSTKPALGTYFIQKYKTDLQHGYLVADKKKGPIPRAYMKILHRLDPHYAEEVAFKASQRPRTQHNLAAAEAIHAARRRLYQRVGGGDL